MNIINFEKQAIKLACIAIAVLALAACSNNKRIGVSGKTAIKSGQGYVAMVISSSQPNVHRGVGQWQSVVIQSLDPKDEKSYFMEASKDDHLQSRLYYGELPIGQYRAVSLYASYAIQENKYEFHQPLDDFAMEFTIKPGVITNLQGLAYHNTGIVLLKDTSPTYTSTIVTTQTNVAQMTRYETGAPAWALQSLTGEQSLSVESVQISNAINALVYQQSLEVMPYLESTSVFDAEKTFSGALLGKLGSWLLYDALMGWEQLHAPTLHALTAAAKLQDNRYLLGTEFGGIYHYDKNSDNWRFLTRIPNSNYISMLEPIESDKALIVYNDGKNHKAYLFDLSSLQLQQVDGLNVKREIAFTLEHKRARMFRFNRGENDNVYFIGNKFYRLNTEMRELVVVEKDEFLYIVNQGNQVLSARPDSFFSYPYAASYDDGKTWENALKSTKIDDFLERQSYVMRNKRLLRVKGRFVNEVEDRHVFETDIYTSRNFAASWEIVATVEGYCENLIYGLSTDDDLMLYCSEGIVYSSKDSGLSWQKAYSFDEQRNSRLANE